MSVLLATSVINRSSDHLDIIDGAGSVVCRVGNDIVADDTDNSVGPPAAVADGLAFRLLYDTYSLLQSWSQTLQTLL